MRTFLANFAYTSASQLYNADFILFKQETYPTPHEIYQQIKSAAVQRGLNVHGPLLWTGITELNENDEGQFNFVEE
jgi:pentose-5-phosphate-3-epimerase